MSKATQGNNDVTSSSIGEGGSAVATVVFGNTFTLDTRYDLQNSRILGKGSFGVVCTAIDTIRNNISIAIKRIRPYCNDEWDAKHTLREIRLMRLLKNHPNIITLYELSLYPPKSELYMMLELMDSDLHKVIQSNKNMTERHFKCFVKQILEAIRAMHSVGVYHRDLKPGNILVSKNCHIRITDFGLARFMDDTTKAGENMMAPMTQYVVTRWYRPPELLLAPNIPYNESVDLWSIGCIMAEMIRGKALWPGKDQLHQIQLIFGLLGYHTAEEIGFPIDADSLRVLSKFSGLKKQPMQSAIPNASEDAIALLTQLLQANPSSRPSADMALGCAWLSDAEVFYDYSKSYLTRPTQDLFDFECKPYSVLELKSMIHEEVEQLSATKYRRNMHGRDLDNSAAGSPTVTGGNLTATSPATAAAPIRRRSETEQNGSSKEETSQVGVKRTSFVEENGELDGPESQLPTVRAGANRNVAVVDNHARNNTGHANPKGTKANKENPFRSHHPPSSSSQSGHSEILATSRSSGNIGGGDDDVDDKIKGESSENSERKSVLHDERDTSTASSQEKASEKNAQNAPTTDGDSRKACCQVA